MVGPLTSIAVGAAALGLWFVTPEGLLLMVVEGLAAANLLVGALNLVPGLPLDGGRVLKSAVWQRHRQRAPRHRRRGLGRAGDRRRRAVLAVPAGAMLGHRARPVRLPARPSSSAFFLWNGATAALASGPAAAAAAAAWSPATWPAVRSSVPEDLPLAEAVRRARDAQAGAIVTVTSAGRPVGVVNEAALTATPEDRRPWLATSTVARGVDDGLSLPVDIAGEDLVRAITRTPATEYLLVEDDGTVYGVLTTADVDRAFRETTAEPRSTGAGRRPDHRADDVPTTPRPGPACTADRCARASGCAWSTARAAATTSASSPASGSSPTAATSSTTS